MQATTDEIRNARQLLEEKRQAVKQSKRINGDDKKQDAIDSLMERARMKYHLPPVIQEAKAPLSIEEIKKQNGIVSLSDLSTDHMTTKQKSDFLSVIQGVKNWRKAVSERTGLSFVLCSRQYGIGKTHIAKAVMGSFASVCLSEDFDAPAIIEQHGIMLTSRQCMELLAHDDWQVKLFHKQRGVVMRGVSNLKILVLDDVGREGILQYIKQESENQEAERQARYYEVINWCYEKGISVFITSNMQKNELESYFNEATWDRLNEMAPKGCMTVLEGIPSYRRFLSGR